jgi:cell division protein ZapA (FtsZ GTPase activity inhibitor)
VEQVIKIEILGETFKFKSDGNRQSLKEVLRYLMTELHKVEEQFPSHALKTNKLAIIVMTALNISKQYVELANSHTDFLETVSTRTSKLDEMIENR